jgi:hypothetical protein
VTRIGTTDGPATEPSNANASTPAVPDPAVETAARDAVRDWLTAAAAETQRPLWIVCIGHGTDDGRVAKLALTGDDLTATEFAAWLAPLKRPVAIVQSTSCSGAFLEPLSAPGRVVVTSTKSGAEQNFAHFGGHIAAAWDDPASDLDQDQQVSLLEAFLVASRQVREFYESDNRLATEHALLDDTGDGQGTRPEAYMGTIPVRDPGTTAALDGYIAAQWVLNPSPAERALPDDFREQRDRLEQQLARMRELKSQVTEDEYYALLDPVLLELARLYATLEATEVKD